MVVTVNVVGNQGPGNDDRDSFCRHCRRSQVRRPAVTENTKSLLQPYVTRLVTRIGHSTVDSRMAAMNGHSSPAIPMDAHPGPVLAYVLSDGSPQVTATNSAFEQAFGDQSIEKPVVDIFDTFGESKATDEPRIETQLAQGGDLEWCVTGDDASETYVVQHASTSDSGGFLVFTAVDEAAAPVSVDNMASVLSHELRNPLDVAQAHLQAARETGEPEHFDAVSEAHDRMSQLIQDVLTLARGEEEITVTESVSIQRVAAEGWAAVETQQADLAMPQSLPTVDADPDRVRRLFENLFRNAVEHGCTDEQTRTDSAQPANSRMQITVGPLQDGFYVADSGAGIPQPEREAVFTPGYTTATSGAGLGLAIVERIAGAHGWELTLTASEQGGARFEVRFQQ